MAQPSAGTPRPGGTCAVNTARPPIGRPHISTLGSAWSPSAIVRRRRSCDRRPADVVAQLDVGLRRWPRPSKGPGRVARGDDEDLVGERPLLRASGPVRTYHCSGTTSASITVERYRRHRPSSASGCTPPNSAPTDGMKSVDTLVMRSAATRTSCASSVSATRSTAGVHAAGSPGEPGEPHRRVQLVQLR